MPRTSPTKNIDNFGGFDVEPFKDLWEYIESKDYERKWLLRTPVFGIDTAENFFIHNKADYDLMQKELEKLREEQKQQNIVSENRIELVRNMHDGLQNRFVRLNNFMRAAKEKRKIAYKKISAEIDKHDELDIQIDIKRRKVDELTLFRDMFRKTNDEYEIYERITNEAVEKSNKFKTADEMMNYCDAIMYGQEDITILGDSLHERIEQMKKRTIEIVKQAQLFTLGLQNDLNNMAHEYVRNQQKCFYWEKLYQQVDEALISHRFKKLRMRESVAHMYGLLCKRRRMYPSIPHGEIEKQMDFIKDEIELLREVLSEYNKSKKINISENKPIWKC